MKSIQTAELSSYKEIYETLFVNYLGEECGGSDCQSIYDRCSKGCGYRQYLKSECNDGLDSAKTKFCDKEGSSKHNICAPWTTYIIIGCAVGAVLLIIGFIVFFFFCIKKKKLFKKKKQSGMTGTGSGSGTGTFATGTNTGGATGATGNTNPGNPNQNMGAGPNPAGPPNQNNPGNQYMDLGTATSGGVRY